MSVETDVSYVTVNQFIKKYPAFALGGIRSLIFNESTNGLAESEAIVRIGRKVLVNESKFFEWLVSQNKVNSKKNKVGSK